MKKIICFAGDIHGDIDGMYKFLQKKEEKCGFKIDHVVHVGDFGVYFPPVTKDFKRYWDGVHKAPIDTYVCPGNHEAWNILTKWMEEPDKMPNLHLMPDGGVVEIPIGEAKLRIGAIWGNYSFRSYNNPERIAHAREVGWKNGWHGPKANHIEKAAVTRMLADGGQLDVLITHDAPAGMAPVYGQPPDFIKMQLGIEKDEAAAGCPGFNHIHVVNKPSLHYFGHFHTYKIIQEAGPRVVALHCFNYVPESAFEFWEFEDWPDGRITASQFNPMVPLERNE